MKKEELIVSFIQGSTNGKASNLKIEGNKLINYDTIIAINKEGNIYLNTDKYSQTTTCNQNWIRKHSNVIEVNEEEIYKL